MKVLSLAFIDALTVKQARRRLTFKEMASITGVNYVTISKIINKRTVTAQERTFDKLNDWLLKEEEK